MELDCFNCPICTTEYDHERNEPRIIPNCGHSVCLNCLMQILKDFSSSFKCPLCNRYLQIKRITPETFPKNYLALNLLDKRRKASLCTVHCTMKDLVCFDCKELICNKCAFKGEHKNHQIDMFEDFMTELDTKVSDLEKWIKLLNEHINGIDSLMNVKRQNLILMIDLKFRGLFELLRNKKRNLLNEINKYFDEMQNIP